MTRCHVDGVERRLPSAVQRRRAPLRWRGGDGAPVVIVVIAPIVVIVMVVVVMFTFGSHVCSPDCWNASSSAAKARAISSRPRTGTRTFSLRTSETPERRETMNSVGNLEAARFGAKLDLLRRAHGLGDDVIAAEAEALQRGYRSRFIIAPMPLGAAGRERVARNDVAVIQGCLGLIVRAPCRCP